MLIKIYRKQKGQAIPIGMALFLILGLMSFVLFNTGQTVSDKSRLVNTADSAAYSGLLWQARAMNFQAYTNRAMVANQVSMAQAVSINSWAAYIAKTGENINTVLGWIPYVGAVTRVVENIGQAVDTVLNPVTQGMLAVVNAVNGSLSIAQKAMYYSAFVATPDVINTVVKSNEPAGQDFKWDTAFSVINVGMNWVEWRKFTESSDGPNQVLAEKERVAMITESRDMFTKERNWKFFGRFMPITPLNWVRIEKVGTTELHERNGKYEWFAKDAISVREKRYNWRGKKKYKDHAIGGGSAIANTDDSYRSILGSDPYFFVHGNRVRHRKAQERPTSEGGRFDIHRSRAMKHYDGIWAYRSLSKERREDEKPPTMKLRIQVSMKTDDINASHENTNGTNNAKYNFDAPIEVPGDVISSVSTAEMYFEKPCFDEGCACVTLDCSIEPANGYSPYWSVRLTPTSGLSRLGAHTLQPGVLSESLASVDPIMSALPSYTGKLANPIDDYIEQSKGVKAIISNLEHQLLTTARGTQAYLNYERRLNAIRANVTFKVDDIAAEFVEKNFTGEEVIDEIAKAAGYDLNTAEVKVVKEHIESVYANMDNLRNLSRDQMKSLSMDIVEAQFSEMVQDQVDALRDQVEDQLIEILEKAVENIMKGMVGSFLEQATGVASTLIDQYEATEQAASGLLNNVQGAIESEVGLEADDIRLRVNDACSMYQDIRAVEEDAKALEAQIETVNKNIATKFEAELRLASTKALNDRARIEADILALEAENAFLSGPDSHISEEDEEAQIRANNVLIGNLQTADAEIPNKRVDALTLKFIAISNDETKALFPGYSVEYRFARRVVEDTLGDIQVLEFDENAASVDQNFYEDDASDGELSDENQSFVEAPEGC